MGTNKADYDIKNQQQPGDLWSIGGQLDIDTVAGGKFTVDGVDMTAAVAALPPAVNYLLGVVAGRKVAGGVHLQVAQSDTIVTGLTTVIAVVICFRDAPTAKQQYAIATIGDQVATPAAGSFLLQTLKSTLAVADDFTDNIHFDWIAFGT